MNMTAMPGTPQPFTCPREAALALLCQAVQREERLSASDASCLGRCAGHGYLPDAVQCWLQKMLLDAGLPGLVER
jgi:hypothetical protein